MRLDDLIDKLIELEGLHGPETQANVYCCPEDHGTVNIERIDVIGGIVVLSICDHEE